MTEAAVIVLRLLQYAAGSILMGSALFAIYALTGERPLWLRPLLIAAALALSLTALLSFIAQTALLTGSLGSALTGQSLEAMLTIDIGKAALWRAGAAGLAALILLMSRPGPALWSAAAGLGTVAVTTFGWMGHGAASESWVQLLADIAHVLAAATWIGALIAFVLMLRSAIEPSRIVGLEHALRRFSAVGVPLVALLVISGLLNSWFLVGMDNVASLPTTDYGRLMLFKLALFVGMLVLATLNRNRHTPALRRENGSPVAIRALRQSIVIEFSLGFGVLAAVAWLGTLAPPAVA